MPLLRAASGRSRRETESMMVQLGSEWNGDRAGSALAVAALHALAGYLLLTAPGLEMGVEADDRLKLFDVPTPLPPPPVTVAPAPARNEAPEGAASPPNLKSRRSPIVAPPQKLDAPSPVAAAPTPGPGSASDAGAAQRAGPGEGSGGEGVGTGSGRRGGGDGGGGLAVRARWVSGRLRDADYPRAASRAGVGGIVSVRFTVAPDGRARGCTVTKSSGNADLDATTCEIIERRFRYKPARDAQGRYVSTTVGWQQRWWQEPARRFSAYR